MSSDGDVAGHRGDLPPPDPPAGAKWSSMSNRVTDYQTHRAGYAGSGDEKGGVLSPDALPDCHGGEEGVGDAEGHGGQEVAHHHHEEEGKGGRGGKGVANYPGENPSPAFQSDRFNLFSGILLI